MEIHPSLLVRPNQCPLLIRPIANPQGWGVQALCIESHLLSICALFSPFRWIGQQAVDTKITWLLAVFGCYLAYYLVSVDTSFKCDNVECWMTCKFGEAFQARFQHSRHLFETLISSSFPSVFLRSLCCLLARLFPDFLVPEIPSSNNWIRLQPKSRLGCTFVTMKQSFCSHFGKCAKRNSMSPRRVSGSPEFSSTNEQVHEFHPKSNPMLLWIHRWRDCIFQVMECLTASIGARYMTVPLADRIVEWCLNRQKMVTGGAEGGELWGTSRIWGRFRYVHRMLSYFTIEWNFLGHRFPRFESSHSRSVYYHRYFCYA